jgi:glycosyltransferase involved in cell wall biosynthesis
VPISVQHYQWHEGAVEQLYQAASAYEACGLEDAHKATSDLATTLKEAQNVVSEKMCPELACSEASSDVVALGVRRIAIVTTVWEHVDGVSRTMKRFASYLRDRDDTSVLVMSPDLAERDYVEANNYQSVHQLVAPVPAIEVPGRPEYKMAAPLQARQRAILEAYNPHVVHVAAPDMLGHSAVRWAGEVGACSVCSYHTAFDTYMQYYRANLLTHPIRHLLRDFYSLCDVVAVPTYAAANHLRSMGIPGEKMGFFPRGVNQTLYNPSMRDDEYRRDIFGASQDEIVILWVARIVREKGLRSFVTTIKSLNDIAQREKDLPKFRVVIAGDGPDLGWVRSELEHFKNVLILGHSSGTNLAKTYAAGDIFFFPSKTEVIPNNLIEAMASGLPVVTDDVGVNRAIVQDEVSGIIVKNTAPLPGDVTNYVDALRRLMKDRELAKRMSSAAVASTNGLTWKRTFESLLHAYDRCRPGLPYARHISRENLDQPKLFASNVEAVEKYRDVIVDDGAPENSLLYRISRGITGGYVRSLDAAKRDDEVIATHGTFERKL